MAQRAAGCLNEKLFCVFQLCFSLLLPSAIPQQTAASEIPRSLSASEAVSFCGLESQYRSMDNGSGRSKETTSEAAADLPPIHGSYVELTV